MGPHVTIHETAQAPCWEMGKPQGIQLGRGSRIELEVGCVGWEGFDVGWRGKGTQARGILSSYGGFVKFDRLTVRSNHPKKQSLLTNVTRASLIDPGSHCIACCLLQA